MNVLNVRFSVGPSFEQRLDVATQVLQAVGHGPMQVRVNQRLGRALRIPLWDATTNQGTTSKADRPVPVH